MPPEPIAEFSANFDAENLRPFLQRIAPLIDTGFGDEQIDRLCECAGKLSVDQEQSLEFPIRYGEHPTVLQVRIVMDDVDTPDLYIFGPASLTFAIQRAFLQFADEHGI